jgi:hypothetical protein
MKKLWKKIKAWFKKHFGDGEDFTETGTATGGSSSKPKTKQNADGDEVAFSALNYCYGGFKPKSDAKVCARIRSLSVGKGMSYRWDNGGCENLGCKDAKDANALACIFFQDASGQWKGGKFDWISTSRLTRDFANIEQHYNGWNAQGFNNAHHYAFVIVSKDGAKRTNVITC